MSPLELKKKFWIWIPDYQVLRAKLNVLNLRRYLGVSTITQQRVSLSAISSTLISPLGSNLESIFMQRAKFLGSFYADDDISVAVRVDN